MLWPILVIGLVVSYWFYRTFFEPYPRFVLDEPLDLDSDRASEHIAVVVDATISYKNSIEILRNGDKFYPAIIDEIRKAQVSVNIEAYVFMHGEVADALADALCERARAGVRVHILPDGIGGYHLAIWRGYLNRLRAAGCQVHFYHPPLRIEMLNIRTHRELFIIDGRVAFTGGAGIADQWMKDTPKCGPQWRDTMFRIEGPAVTRLQGIFIENWTETCGHILSRENLPGLSSAGELSCMVINSYARWRTSPARILHHVLLASAKREICIASPYFVPDRWIRQQLRKAASNGVRVTVITTNRNTDHATVRAGSRRLYGRLLRAGAKINEYDGGLYHVKLLIVDHRWVVFGTANFDNRSLSINDEVCVASSEPMLIERLYNDFQQDLKQSQAITLDKWKRRRLLERAHAQVSRLIERQQ